MMVARALPVFPSRLPDAERPAGVPDPEDQQVFEAPNSAFAES
jgi:hypothetical protein